MINWWSTELGSEAQSEMNRAFDQKRMTLGSSVNECERLFSESLEVPFAVLTNSGSSALLMSLLALDLKPGDEVIVPALTWIATAQSAAILGCKVHLCDCNDDAPVMDLNHLRALVNPKTRAIIPVHLNGRECAIDEVLAIASTVGAHVVEDACKALFSRNERGFLGTFGSTGCFSLGMISPVSIGYGGLVVTRDRNVYERLVKIRDHGVQRAPESYQYLGYNFKVSDLLASLALPQIRKREERIDTFIKIHEIYSQKIDNPVLTILPIEIGSGKVPIYVEARSTKREPLIEYLKGHAITVSRYHFPVTSASYLRNSSICPNAERLTKECFILPSGPAQKLEDIEYVVKVINEFQPQESYERDYSFSHK